MRGVKRTGPVSASIEPAPLFNLPVGLTRGAAWRDRAYKTRVHDYYKVLPTGACRLSRRGPRTIQDTFNAEVRSACDRPIR